MHRETLAVSSRWRPPKPSLALAAIVVLAFVVYGSLAHLVTAPRVFPDETLYFDAADSLVSGGGLRARGELYERGVLYPIVLAPILGASPDRSTAYELAKLLNALFFALAAVPIYLLSRRLLSVWSSLAVAGLGVLVPSSVYVSTVMTESVAYLVFCVAMYAIVLAVERPTPWRQFAALGSILLAFGARAQFAVLLAAYFLSLALAPFLASGRRCPSRHVFTRMWPTALSLVVLVAVVVLAVLRGHSPRDSLGVYGDAGPVARLPDVGAAAKWFVYLLADLDLYLAVIPLAVMPIVVVAFFRRARAGSPGHRAFLVFFMLVNVFMVALVAMIASDFEESGTIGLHDRYLFYLAPLWLVVFIAWLSMGSARADRAAALGASSAVLLGGLFPYMNLDVRNAGVLFNAVGSGLPAALGEGVSPARQRIAAVLICGVVVGLALVLRKRRVVFSAAAVIAVFALNAVLVWGHAFVLPADEVFSRAGTGRSWVDEAVPPGASVAMLYLPCREEPDPPKSFLLTEFFNASIGPVVRIEGVRPGTTSGFGRVPTIFHYSSGLAAEYVVVQPGIPLRGRRVREGTTDKLVLWKVSGRIRLSRSYSIRELAFATCSRAT